MSKMLEVRREYGEPFVDVVRGFADLGYSKTATAGALGFNLSYFRQLLTRFDLHGCFKPQRDMVRCCKGGGGGWTKGVKRLNLHKPINYKGQEWRPGEPTYHYLYAQGVRPNGRKAYGKKKTRTI